MTTILIAQFTKHGEWHAVTRPTGWGLGWLQLVQGLVLPACHVYPANKPRDGVREADLHAQVGVHVTCNWCRRKLGLPVLEKGRRKRADLAPEQHEQVCEVLAPHSMGTAKPIDIYKPLPPLSELLDRR